MKKFNLLSIIVPAYKQEKTIIQDIEKIDNVMIQLRYDYEIIVVVDGFVDDTFKNAKKISNKHLRVFGYKENQGKGHAIGLGMIKSKGAIVGFIDAGMDISPTGIEILLNLMLWQDADIVIGSKLHSDSKVDYPFFRLILSWGYRTLIHLFFGFNVRDTQVGLKFFRREVVEKVFPKLLVKTFAFDVEILAVANAMGFKKIYEGPVELNFSGSSSMTSSNFWLIIFLMLRDTMAIFYRLKITKYYSKRSNNC